MSETKFKYARTLVTATVGITAGQTLSQLFDCGGIQLRGVLLPSNWTTCSLGFNGAVVNDNAQLFAINNFDGSFLTPLVIPGTVSESWIPLVPYWLDAVPYIQLQTSVAQASDVVITLVLEPLYQGVHG